MNPNFRGLQQTAAVLPQGTETSLLRQSLLNADVNRPGNMSSSNMDSFPGVSSTARVANASALRFTTGFLDGGPARERQADQFLQLKSYERNDQVPLEPSLIGIDGRMDPASSDSFRIDGRGLARSDGGQTIAQMLRGGDKPILRGDIALSNDQYSASVGRYYREINFRTESPGLNMSSSDVMFSPDDDALDGTNDPMLSTGMMEQEYLGEGPL